jgi:hypothetical protein
VVPAFGSWIILIYLDLESGKLLEILRVPFHFADAHLISDTITLNLYGCCWQKGTDQKYEVDEVVEPFVICYIWKLVRLSKC